MNREKTKRKRGRPLGERSLRIIELYQAGRAPLDIARAVACSPAQVYGVLHRQKAWRPQPERRPLAGAEAVLRRLHNAGLSQALLARMLGVSPVAVFKALKRKQKKPKRQATRKAPAGDPSPPRNAED